MPAGTIPSLIKDAAGEAHAQPSDGVSRACTPGARARRLWPLRRQRARSQNDGDDRNSPYTTALLEYIEKPESVGGQDIPRGWGSGKKGHGRSPSSPTRTARFRATRCISHVQGRRRESDSGSAGSKHRSGGQAAAWTAEEACGVERVFKWAIGRQYGRGIRTR